MTHPGKEIRQEKEQKEGGTWRKLGKGERVSNARGYENWANYGVCTCQE